MERIGLISTTLKAPIRIGTFFRLTTIIKLKLMKELLERLNVENENTHEGFHIGTTIMVILLFLAFMGTSFYLMVTNS